MVQLFPIGDGEVRVYVSVDAVSPDSEITIDLPFRKGQILRHKAFASGGGVGSIETFLSRSADAPASSPLDVEFRATALGDDADPALPTTIDEQPTWPVLFYAGTPEQGFTSTEQGRLFYRPTPDVIGASVVAEFILRKGWPPRASS